MIRRPPRSTQGVSSAASDVYKRQMLLDVPKIQNKSISVPHSAEPESRKQSEPQTHFGIDIGVGALSKDRMEELKRQRLSRPPLKRNDNQIDLLDAVSYTHLRAHETSLHLVCRLLLEKKKNHHRILAPCEHHKPLP
eukprot:TRINITY_DN23811_c0_g1_i3.p2 TRINITY_DN23811_c0_g1~~TRINITY_DN23811_c0_g1_i3.p2  ORF type:complete len:137 (-),score=26.33 TRINITY_DN23811_c0_g1_i3:60-470(-)